MRHVVAGARSTTFIPNQELPVHRWFRYSAGFSGAWAAAEVARQSGRRVLDPFAGSGTTLVAAQQANVASVGVEAHPFVFRVARAKLGWTSDVARFEKTALGVLASAKRARRRESTRAPPLIERIYDRDALEKLFAIARALERSARCHDLPWLALVSILRSCSHANTAPWQYVLPRKSKRRVLEPFEAYAAQVELMARDMRALGRAGARPPAAKLLRGDARRCARVAPSSVDLVLTSPPYPNNYDYADATRLEMSFFGEVMRWADLHYAVRRHLVPSCSQHSHTERFELGALLADPLLDPIRTELAPACRALAELRATRAGRKTYDTMVAAYFAEMARVWQTLGRVVRRGGRACFVIGDSAPYGVHVPVPRWLAALGEAHGFRSLGFEPTRQRNTKWKNRKHRVPLCEGRLWMQRA
jgi:DNA methylase